MTTPQKPSAMADEEIKDVLCLLRNHWLRNSLIRTFGFEKYTTELERGRPLIRVLESSKLPRLVVHPILARRLRRNMGWIGRFFGWKIVDEPFMEEHTISAIDFSILDKWKMRQPVDLPQPLPRSRGCYPFPQER